MYDLVAERLGELRVQTQHLEEATYLDALQVAVGDCLNVAGRLDQRFGVQWVRYVATDQITFACSLGEEEKVEKKVSKWILGTQF